jgi:hypothetical protein
MTDVDLREAGPEDAELKPSIPLRANGIPIRHELVLGLIR